jgi:HSP20 family protein
MISQRMINFPSMVRQHPFAELHRMARRLDLLTNSLFGRPHLGSFPSRVFPAVNITEDNDKYFIRAELPGIKSENIHLQVDGKILTISGERKIPSEGENAKYHRREREAGMFSRAIGLTSDIDTESVVAKMVNGVLMVEISKSEAAKPKQITVN